MLTLEERIVSAPTFVAFAATLVDPITGIEIPGVATAELSATHLRFRADDGLVWAVPKDLVVMNALAAGDLR